MMHRHRLQVYRQRHHRPRRPGAGPQAAVDVHRRRRRKGLHHLVWEIVDNAVDEYLNGHADTITVTLHKNGDAVTVSDNGRGIPSICIPSTRSRRWS